MRATTVPLLTGGSKSGDSSGDLAFGFGPNGDLSQIYGYSIQAIYTNGAPAGTLVLQASNDGINFCDIAGTSFVVTGTGNFLWNVTNSNYLYVQMAWTPDGGGSTGTMQSLAYIRGF